ncbi:MULTISPECIES: acyl carrier protein [unclassified Micromonospora]|uniref:acyl carrier protein n=1 Tax=unclassified Micromonospora TaxID=2617518 RepID=UPI0010477A79|nr:MULTISPECIES: acyl carrier protein [unclassified Micromonospora]TDB81631.1 acyl carrier protein [Micromonospora sp. KC721]TDC42944.1 acyl carrier protein [Micromonospora sp. KC213]
MEIENGIRKILNTELFVEVPPEQIGLDDSLRAVYGLDSLGFVELRVQCEDMFDVRISDQDFTPENFQSLRTVAALVRRLRTEARA